MSYDWFDEIRSHRPCPVSDSPRGQNRIVCTISNFNDRGLPSNAGANRSENSRSSLFVH